MRNEKTTIPLGSLSVATSSTLFELQKRRTKRRNCRWPAKRLAFPVPPPVSCRTVIIVIAALKRPASCCSSSPANSRTTSGRCAACCSALLAPPAKRYLSQNQLPARICNQLVPQPQLAFETSKETTATGRRRIVSCRVSAAARETLSAPANRQRRKNRAAAKLVVAPDAAEPMHCSRLPMRRRPVCFGSGARVSQPIIWVVGVFEKLAVEFGEARRRRRRRWRPVAQRAI